ncbi:MAG: hypothetical protein M1377_05315 [Deltaproteobacteria bacterium]|nr:hypothetical protein [Deltaproteobacteria bacterium]
MKGSSDTSGPKRNCWDVMGCGREPGGSKVAEKGVCPAAVEIRVDGVNGGKNGGRACWAVSGTFCGAEVQGSYAARMDSCMFCPFYKQVLAEEGEGFVPAITILLKLQKVLA